MEAICQISLEALENNYRYFQNRVAPARVIPVVKANAYGHGAIRVTEHLKKTFAVNTFAVATLEEARELAEVLDDISILIFSRVFPSELNHLPAKAILSIGSMEDARAIQQVSSEQIKVHLNINTGMNRLGVTLEEALALLSESTSCLDVVGVYSHFSSSDTANEKVYKAQNTRFDTISKTLMESGYSGEFHLSNSAAALHEDQNIFDAIRLGIGLYGYDTTPYQGHKGVLKPVMEVQAPLVRVEQVRAGESVSYGEKWQAAMNTNVGTLRMGYADGYNRLLTNRGYVSYGDKIYPVIGTVTMDHIMIDLGEDIPETGQMFTVMGGGFVETKINTISRNLNTIPYEVCCAIASRVKRYYL